ncbi:hypothetical protein [Morganella psychrotolerans]|uniref:hypothetical protein n=1 Tax=Morganella psychrotolerans TaxID=368603 RepID=UPI0039AFB29D
MSPKISPKTSNGGNLVIINGTTSKWYKIHQHSYQMDEWSFPEIIDRGARAGTHIEFNTTFGNDINNDAGEVTYELEGTTNAMSFTIQARCVNNEFFLQVHFKNISTTSHDKGSICKIGWEHNGTVYFVLSYIERSYISSCDLIASDWMQNSPLQVQNTKLKELCMPGTHDSGMSFYTADTTHARHCNTVTQYKGIFEQLEMGARYFDVRPVLYKNDFYTGHYGNTNTPVGWQGANGQSISSIINEVNSFTASHKELIILNFSHALNRDNNYWDFTKDDWNKLIAKLSSIKNLYCIENYKKQDLTEKYLNSFIYKQASVLLIFEGKNIDLGNKEGLGFFYHSDFNTYNSYSDTEDVSYMISDQTEKMNKQTPGRHFLLSWTLTQSAINAISCWSSILQLATTANWELYRAYDNTTKNHYPNILYIDGMKDTSAAAISIAINSYLHP